MSEDLEKIKQLCDVEVPYNEVCSIHANALGEIQEAAERMAAEIARLKAELEKFQLVATSCNDEANISQITRMVNRAIGEGREGEGSDLYWAQCWCLLREIKHLKAELEKRPEVVRCGECEHKEWCRKSINKDGHGDMCPLSFCSCGQRRESEGK